MAENHEEEEFGELAVVFGDFHIPMRSTDIPDQFKELIVPNKVQYVMCTGNIGSRDTLDWVKSLSSNCHIVKGDFDDNNDFPEIKTIKIGNFKISLIHGHQVVPWGDEEALYNQLRQLDTDILISGHTHDQKASKIDKKYLLNPGSITGAYSPITKNILPSFLLLEIKEKSVDVYLYQLQDSELKIKKTIITK
ncbi:vacuolar sorting protein, putative [Ichthyophthirius multifiliis]|uniref:Vacuolar protein sorting-associated protein 29 n=1 Tax=Ichthyophthirius multifiliis TaxID=5932 RepID=G0QRM1_ICHMU|nr:vacuolar sorting protein, putative [Ichthyophthirius multifiliis]EGR32142.1 vacuolar sorting protein, putative [Ichthyophthirius multifiliis]|eukprot:XP_004035628.1 vacuolar sorting protein, putative [Ichthyophthirius multifiliis]